MKHLLSSKDLTKKDIENILDMAASFDKNLHNKRLNKAKGSLLATLFFETSTRTRMSFETAMLRLGGHTVSVPDMMGMSSSKKGETLQDTAKIVSSYVDVIAVRHFDPGAVKELAGGSSVPVVNAGDGSNEHPTQALIDLYTFKKEFGHIDKLKIGMVGDLKYGRTVHSQALLLSIFDVELVLISPDALKMPKKFLNELDKKDIKYTETESLTDVIRDLDVIYQTRVQEERFADRSEYMKYRDEYIIDENMMNKAKDKSILMHPLPRITEITKEVDKDSRACYFKQAANGVPVRMAIISYLLDRNV